MESPVLRSFASHSGSATVATQTPVAIAIAHVDCSALVTLRAT
jgi:hypothetical protein